MSKKSFASFNSIRPFVGTKAMGNLIKLPLINALSVNAARTAIVLTCICALPSCQKEGNILAPSKGIELSANETNTLQKDFANILAKAIQAEPGIRQLLKDEALKQFDNDDDVLYSIVKDKIIGKDESFRDALIKYSSAEKLSYIEAKMPLLTIFVPTLPSGFSPKMWDANKQIPVIAVSLRVDNNVPYYGQNGEQGIIKPGQTPAFPILVVKQNERVIAELSGGNAEKENVSLQFYNEAGIIFKFIDKSFDNVHTTLSSTKAEPGAGRSRHASVSEIDQINTDAYLFNGPDPNVQWQRDWIYYQISDDLTASRPYVYPTGNPPTNRGSFDRNYIESIRSMKFSADAFYKMSDQTEDPGIKTQTTTPGSPWTEGRFEIRISLLTNAKNSVGSEYKRIISVNPADIYDVNYNYSGYGFYTFSSITPKELRPNVDLLPWDLYNYGSVWKFVFYETDVSGTTAYNTSNSSTYGANFDVSAGITTKTSAKFGASFSTTSTASYTLTTSLGDDFLGESVLSFDRPVVKSGSYVNGYDTNEIDTGGTYGYLSLSVEAIRY
ncbi:hypothetical protein GCM10023172_19330 [Hymenobacter ginsengisoli]|uniref:Uncharacterized protein n=1 Tax=Hymenobacter ginsengisoli TaxID=1051626 RepID=A0ABP8QCV8_9BACT|nr:MULTISPECIES: hypothetical protein [unclassified Hymenobacter]MBO2031508.1 hypothetical protein [Hymenobacter sp. BT559]